MAISGGDGSIILTTEVNTSGMEKGTASLKSQAAKLAAEYRKAGMSQSEAFKKAWSEIERTRKETDSATKSTENFGKQSQKSGKQAKSAFDGLKATLQSVAGYLALAFSVTKIIQFSNEAGQLATQTEASVQRLVDIYGSASDSVGDFIDANARAIGMSKASASSFASVYGNLFSVWADQATNAELTNRYLNMTAVVASKTGRTVEDVQERIRSGLLGNTEAIEDLGVFVNVKTIEMTDAFQRMANGKSWEQLDAYTQQQVRTMAILEQATAKYGNTVADTTATTRAQYQAAYEDFKNTWGIVVNKILMPVMKTLTSIFEVATNVLQTVFRISGKSIDVDTTSLDKQQQSISSAVDSQNDLSKAVEKTNKATKKSLADFDEISILSKQTSNVATSGTTGSAMGGIDPNATFSITSIGTEAKKANNEVSGLKKTVDDLFYKTLGKVSVTSLSNLQNALLKFKNSAKALGSVFPFIGDIDITDLFSKYINSQVKVWTTILTISSGWLNTQLGLFKKDYKTAWEGLGRVIGGFGMGTTYWLDAWGLKNFFGYSVEDLKKLFIPINQEVTNLYRGLSTEASQALEKVTNKFVSLNSKITKLSWSDKIITKSDVKEVLSSLDDLFSEAYNQAKDNKEKAVQNLNELVSKGLMTDEEAKIAYEKLDKTYNDQEKLLSSSKKRIKEILTTAKNEHRKLTDAEKQEIVSLTQKAEDNITSIIKVGAGDRQTILKELEDNRNKLSKERLSQIIQFANQERDAQVKQAKETYDKTIEEANKLYYDLGVIDEDRYNDIVKNAKKQKDAQITEAENSRKALVDKALKTAKGVAKAVDPETGEILSNWETIWNSAYDKVVDFQKKIKNIPRIIANFFIDAFNKVIDVINRVLFFEPPSWLKNYAKYFNINFDTSGKIAHIPKMPMLAQGAVLPPNKPFMAVVGDQKHGTNIEAPADLIKQMVNEALLENGTNQQINIVAKGDLDSIISLFRFEIERQDRLAGATI